MKIRQLSDLHRERGPFSYVDEGEDVVVLAGDISNGVEGIEWAKTIPKPVVFVAGNHDHWGCDLIDNIESMRAAAVGSNVHFLECDEVVITINDESVRFLGTTLWTDYCEAYLVKHGQNLEDERQRQMMYFAHKSMNDFMQITYAKEPLTAKILLEIHRKSRAWLKDKIADRFDGKTVVVTHHAPSYQSLIHANDVKADDLSRIIQSDRRPDDRHERVASYASDLEDLAVKVDFWLHGHIHSSMMYNINKCLVVVNPRGYIRGPQKSNFWWHMSPAQENKSLAEFNKNPEKGDVVKFNKAFIIDTESTMPAYMLAQAKDKIVEINKVIKIMATYIKYTKNEDVHIAAMAINKTNATIESYNELVNETIKLICYSENMAAFGNADSMVFRLKLPVFEKRLLATGILAGIDMTENPTEYQDYYFKDAPANTRRALATMRKAIKIIRAKLNQKPSLTINIKADTRNGRLVSSNAKKTCVELREEQSEKLILLATLSKTNETLTAEFCGEEFIRNTTEGMIEVLLSLGITTSDLRFTADPDHALSVGQTIEIRSALRDHYKALYHIDRDLAEKLADEAILVCGLKPKSAL